MRQGQQNRRGRGRNRSKGQNPITKSFESNGPDSVKIRGTPAHIAEKYISYARDALSSSDRVLAENYLQHAEHYNRIIMAFRDQSTQQSGEHTGSGGARVQQGGFGDYSESGDDGEEDQYDGGFDGHRQQPRFAQPAPEGEPQPRIEPRMESRNEQRGDPRAEGEGQRRQQRSRPHRPRPDRNPDRNNERSERQVSERQVYDRGEDQRQPQQQFAAPVTGSDEAPSGNGRVAHDGHPEFLRRPVRRPRRDENGHGDAPAPVRGAGDAAEETVD